MSCLTLYPIAAKCARKSILVYKPLQTHISQLGMYGNFSPIERTLAGSNPRRCILSFFFANLKKIFFFFFSFRFGCKGLMKSFFPQCRMDCLHKYNCLYTKLMLRIISKQISFPAILPQVQP